MRQGQTSLTQRMKNRWEPPRPCEQARAQNLGAETLWRKHSQDESMAGWDTLAVGYFSIRLQER